MQHDEIPTAWRFMSLLSKAGDIAIEGRSRIHNQPVYVCRVYSNGWRDANARLIIAAPELLEALDWMANRFAAVVGLTADSTLDPADHECLEAARTAIAIAKAIGQKE